MAKLNKLVTTYIDKHHTTKTPKQLAKEINKHALGEVSEERVAQYIESIGGEVNTKKNTSVASTNRFDKEAAKRMMVHPVGGDPSKPKVTMMTREASMVADEAIKRLPKSSVNPDFIMKKDKK